MAEAMLPGFIPPCLPTKAKEPPCGAAWVHEIKHDGFRMIARKEGKRVRLFTRNGHDFAHRFALIVDAVAALRARSCILDGEAVASGDDGVPNFDRIRYRRCDGSVFLYAFDLIELNGDDLRREPLAVRKATLASVLAKAAPGVRLSEHLDHDDGAIVFRHACKMGLEGHRVEAEGFRLSFGTLVRLAQDVESGLRGGAPGSGRGLGEMTNEALAQVERLIADCKKRIERQREVVANGFQKGHDTDIAISMLRALEASLSAFEKHRQFVLDQQKTADRR
jgi:bifunctional non-homologous end joining protein LigD